jgi:hypothetical protein
MSIPEDPTSRRATFLPMLLASVGGFFFLLVLILLTGGWFFYVVLAVMGFISLACFHWLVWGKLLTQLTAGEREEAELLDRVREQQETRRVTTYRR